MAVISRCLRKNPSERFQRADEVKRALQQVGRSASVPAIAVLPFQNLSAEKEDEYFSDGLTEEIINALTKIAGLRVTACTSAFAFGARNTISGKSAPGSGPTTSSKGASGGPAFMLVRPALTVIRGAIGLILILRYTLCIIGCMRTNIELNDDLMREAMRHSKAKTKRALIEEALRTLVRVRTEESRRRSYQDRLTAVQQRLAGLTFRDSSAALIRQDREGR